MKWESWFIKLFFLPAYIVNVEFNNSEQFSKGTIQQRSKLWHDMDHEILVDDYRDPDFMACY